MVIGRVLPWYRYHPWHLVGALGYPYNLLSKITREHHRALDQLIVAVTHNSLVFPHGFFPEGWGELEVPENFYRYLEESKMKLREGSLQLPELRAHINPEPVVRDQDALVYEGEFETPVEESRQYLPKESHKGYFQLVAPSSWQPQEKFFLGGRNMKQSHLYSSEQHRESRTQESSLSNRAHRMEEYGVSGQRENAQGGATGGHTRHESKKSHGGSALALDGGSPAKRMAKSLADNTSDYRAAVSSTAAPPFPSRAPSSSSAYSSSNRGGTWSSIPLSEPPTSSSAQQNSSNASFASSRSLVLLLPGTGEAGYGRRLACVGLPLARLGVGSLILEGPFYGRRRPPGQRGTKLRRVSDLPVLGRVTIEEAQSLLWWAKRQLGVHCLAVSGGSMGGLHSAMTAALSPFQVGVASWLGPPSAVSAFTEGLFATSCNWEMLKKEAEGRPIGDAVKIVGALCDHDKMGLEKLKEEDESVAHVKFQMRKFLALTDLRNFPVPVRPDAAIFTVGKDDAYIGDQHNVWEALQQKWQQSEVRYLDGGHVSGILFERKSYQDTIIEVLEKLKRKVGEKAEETTKRKDEQYRRSASAGM